MYCADECGVKLCVDIYQYMSQDFVLLGCMSRSGRVGSQGSRKELLQLPASVDISKCLQRHVGVYKKDLLELGCCR